jgi:hypothetical protein
MRLYYVFLYEHGVGVTKVDQDQRLVKRLLV